MKFRPCIDIHEGSVKQIIGASLHDAAGAQENFVADLDAAAYAALYRAHALSGGHVILLDRPGTPAYTASRAQAESALHAWPQGMMIGGGITPENAEEFLRAGASHVIVTSYVFHEGKIDRARLRTMQETVGKERLVLDLSCRKVGQGYSIATDRWQKTTREELTPELLQELEETCAEFLVHAVDVEGKVAGIAEEIVTLLAQSCTIPVTYAGGIASFDDILRIRECGNGRVDFTIGSALDLFGGTLPFAEIAKRF